MPAAENHRAARETQTRAVAETRPVWKPLDQYPLPIVAGLVFRWLRTEQPGQPGVPDTRNISRRFREGWVPTPAHEHPELQMQSESHSRWPEGIEIAGQLLCQIPQSVVDARNAYYRRQSDRQMEAVDHSMFQQNVPGDHGMQMFSPKRRSRVATGKRATRETAEE